MYVSMDGRHVLITSSGFVLRNNVYLMKLSGRISFSAGILFWRYLATRRPCLLTVNASASVRQCSHCGTDALAEGMTENRRTL